MSQPNPSGASRQSMDERYGVRPPSGRRRIIAAVAVFAVVALAWLLWAAWSQSSNDVRGSLFSFEVRSANAVFVEIAIYRDSGERVECDVTAHASDHMTVGEGVVEVPAGDSGDLRTTMTLRTDRRATTATVTNCRFAD